MTTSHLSCTCGSVRIDVSGAPIASVECCCGTCRESAARLARLDGAPTVVGDFGATPYVMYRKDRVRFVEGDDRLHAFRLTPDTTTRRFVASCCNTPMFLEFRGGHWLSVYGVLWPEADRPPLQLRTMTASLEDRSILPDDVPNPKQHTFWFIRRLLGAWIAMRFRSPQLRLEGELHA